MLGDHHDSRGPCQWEKGSESFKSEASANPADKAGAPDCDFGEEEVHTSSVFGHYGELRQIDSVRGGRKVIRNKEYGIGETDSGHDPNHGLGWMSVAVLQIGDVVGVGVLTMGSAFNSLGWFLAIFFLCFFLFINVYVGILLSRSYALFPAGVSYSEMARLTVRNSCFSWMVNIVFYVYVTAALGSYVLAAGQTLGELFFHWDTCQPIQSVVAVCLILVPLQLRSFTSAKPLLWLNTFLIMLAVFLCLGYMLSNMNSHLDLMASLGTPVSTQIFPSELTWVTFFNGIGSLCFAYLGQYLFLEIQVEMKNPNDFAKAFTISGPFQLFMYSFVGTVSYLYDGSYTKDSIIQQLKPTQNPEMLIVAAASLFLHLTISFLIKGKVLCRALHMKVHPHTVNDPSWRGKLVWFGCTLALTIATYIIANAIPFFSVLTSLLGGFAGPFLGFMCPITFFIFSHKRAEVPIRRAERFLLYFIFVLALAILCCTTSANIYTLITKLEEGSSPPFQCTTKESYYDKNL